MATQSQIVAIEKGVKARVYAVLTDLNKIAQKPDLFNGLAKTYQPIDEAGEQLPAESKRVQFNVREVLLTARKHLTELYDLTARKDWTNCIAKADVVINGETLLRGVPATYLLFLEKQLTDIRTFVSNLPVLDIADEWYYDANSGLNHTARITTHRTKKSQRALVLYPATPEHPAQTQLITEDLLAGHWNTVKHSGAMTKPVKDLLLERVDLSLKAVKEARERANAVNEADVGGSVGDALFDYILG